MKRSLCIFFILLLLPLRSSGQAEQWVKVYFNMPADFSVATDGNAATVVSELTQTLITLVDSARYSIDLSIYDFEHPKVAEALARAAARGVRVRVVTDNFNRTDGGEHDLYVWQTLASAGIYSIDDDGDVYTPEGAIIDSKLVNSGTDMHHKFAVIDALSSTPEDDFVWTGSTNLTWTGNYNTNHAIVIKHTGVAAAYLGEFEQMWGSNSEVPNPKNARFHKDKQHTGLHDFVVNGERVEVYFSPVDRQKRKPSISRRLVELIEKEADNDLKFQAFAFTPTIPVAEALWDKTARTDISLQGVIDPQFFSRYKKSGDIWGSPEASSGNRLILGAREMRKLHHKILLIDAENPDSDDVAITITGSYNFSNNAELSNDENLLIIHSDNIANQFYQDFMGALNRAQGKAEIPAPEIDPQNWYRVFSIGDGSRFEVEIAPGFGYSARFLGLQVPRVYAGADSSDYLASAVLEYVKRMLEGKKVRLTGPYSKAPVARNGAFQAYVEIDTGEEVLSANKLLLENGLAATAPYYAQHPDSIRAFSSYEEKAKNLEKGLWKKPELMHSKELRVKEMEGILMSDVLFPINLNLADEAMLQLLPGIGQAFAKRIIEYRNEIGLFRSIDELEKVKGIGPKTMEKLRPLIVID